MAAYEGTSNGGAGGKFRKRPFLRSQATPYDRPPTALRPTQNLNNGWFSKIVDPASKLISTGAHKLFSSVFRKRLLPPPPSPPQHPPDDRKEIEDVQPEAATHVASFATKEQVVGQGTNADSTSNGKGVAELEDILKQKTFTRSEIDHLTSLLLSRTVENSDGADKGRSERKSSDVLAIHAGHEKSSNLPDGTRIEQALPGAISTPDVRSKVSQDVVSSPAEIAKAYMGNRPANPSSSALGWQNQMPKEDMPSLYDPLAKQISPAMSLIQKPGSDFGATSNGLMTPKYRGRSAIYNMARTPYTRAHSVMAIRAGETNVNVSGGSSLYRNGAETNQSEKQVLKRRSSVFENDIGSVGPIRRIRQKPNLLHPKILSLPPPGRPHGTNVPGLVSDVEVPSSMEWRSQNYSLSKVVKENGAPSSSGGYVPSQSTETAQKIFEQLEKFTPKGKSREKKTDVNEGNSPTKVRPSLLEGSAQQSMETVGSLKVLQRAQDSGKVNGMLDPVSAHGHFPNPSLRVEDASVKKLVIPSDNLAQNGSECRDTVSHVPNKSKAADYMVPLSGVECPPKKRAFQMSALEDCPELDDDVPANGGVLTTPLSEGREHDESVAIPSISRSQPIIVEKPSESKLAASLSLQRVIESQANCSAAVATTASPSLLLAPSSAPDTRITTQEVSAPQLAVKLDKVGPQNEANNSISTSSFKSDELPSSSFSTSPVVVSAASKDTKPGAQSSANDAAAVSNGPDKTDSKSTQRFGNTFMKSGDFSSVMSPAKGASSIGLQINNATPSNGLQTGSAAPTTNQGSVSSPLFPGAMKLTNGSFGLATSAADVGTSTSTAISSSITAALPITTTAPISFPTFKSQSTSAASADTIDTSGFKSNGIGFGNPSSIFGVNPSASASGGNSASASSTSTLRAAGDGAQTAGPPASSGVPFGFQTSGTSVSSLSSSSGLIASSVSAPTSASSPSIFGFPTTFSANASGSSVGTSFSFGASTFGSTAANPFNSLGSTSSALGSSSTTSSVTTSSAGVFSFQSQKPATLGSTPAVTPPSSQPSFGLGLSGSSAATSSSLIFGAAANSSSTANSSPFTFGSSSGAAAPVFSVPSPAVPTPSMPTPVFQSQPLFGKASPHPVAFGSNPSTNSDQMTMEDSMAEDSMQPSPPAVPAFGAPVSAPSGGFAFPGAPAPATSFQFPTPQSQFAPPSTPFQPSGSVEFNGGHANSFSLGTNDGDKSNRRYVKARKRVGRK